MGADPADVTLNKSLGNQVSVLPEKESRMAIPQKGMRKLEHNGNQYGWRIRKKPTYNQGAFQGRMTVAIQNLINNDTCVLLVELSVDRPDNWISTHYTSISPQLVRKMIEKALCEGWVSNIHGNTFHSKFAIIKHLPA